MECSGIQPLMGIYQYMTCMHACASSQGIRHIRASYIITICALPLFVFLCEITGPRVKSAHCLSRGQAADLVYVNMANFEMVHMDGQVQPAPAFSLIYGYQKAP